MMKGWWPKESDTIAGAALIIGASAVLSRLLGLVRDRLLVVRFGIGDDLDAYYASFQVPNLLFSLLVLGTLSVAFIPVFTEYLTRKRESEALHVAETVLTVVAVGMGVACILLIAAAPQLVRLVAPGFEGEKLGLTVRLTRVMMLSPLFFAVSAVLSSVLNSFKRFVTVSFAPLLYNGALIFGIVVLSKPLGVLGVAVGAVLGAALHVLIQLPEVRGLGLRFRPSLDVGHPGVRDIGRLFLPRVFGIDISQISLLLGSVIGTTLVAGSVALFNLAMNIAAVPLGAVAIPFAVAAFPSLAEASAASDRKGFVAVFAATFRQVLFFMIPLSALAVLLRVHVVRVVIGAQGLTWHDMGLAAASFGIFSASLPFQSLTPLLARSFYALKDTLVPVLISLAALIANLLAVRLALPRLGREVQVIALPLAFSAAAFVQVVLLLAILRRKFGPIGGRGILRALLKFFAGAVAALAAAWTFLRLTGEPYDGEGFLGVFIQAAGATVLGAVAYGLVLWKLRSEEMLTLTAAVRKRLFKVRPDMPMGDTQGM
jgi:putative peptidoglycan lipid II flippase